MLSGPGPHRIGSTVAKTLPLCRPLRALNLPRRDLQFPVEHSAGTVYVRGPGHRSALGRAGRRWNHGWREAGEARGVVTVEPGNQVKLRAHRRNLIEGTAGGPGGGLGSAWSDAGPLHRLGPRDLQALSLGGAATASVLDSLGHLTGLEVLDLWTAPIGDEAVSAVARLSGLRVLDLWGTRVSDTGLRALAPLEGLRRLTAPGRQTGDAGIPCLADLGGLRELSLSGSSVTDAGLAMLTRAHSLVRLSLWGTRVTDAGLQHLHQLTSLAELDLGATAVTDQGLSHVRRLPLRWVSLRDTLVSPEGLRGLRAALPACRVEPLEDETCQAWRPHTGRPGL